MCFSLIYLICVFSRVILGEIVLETLADDLAQIVEVNESTGMITKWATFQSENPELFPTDKNMCNLCVVTINSFILTRKGLNLPDSFFKTAANVLCSTVAAAFVEKSVCSGLVDIMLDDLLYIIDYTDLKGTEICCIIMQNYNCYCDLPNDWSIAVSSGIAKPLKMSQVNEAPAKILHVTDIHYDDLYSSEVDVNCGKPLCCHVNDPLAENTQNKSGFWTDYRSCDIPKRLITNTFDYIRNNLEIDYVYFTGDIYSHFVWGSSKESVANSVKTITEEFRKAFPDKPVFPVLGNHEAHPVNLFAPEYLKYDEELSSQWIFNMAYDSWKQLLPKGTDFSTIRLGGYYTALARPGLRIIAINSNVGSCYNFYILLDDKDPYQQLSWLERTLKDAENADESVHILMHTPPGDELTFFRWAREFRKIIQRYYTTITGIFYGHTHYDEFNVFFNEANEAYNVGYNGGSLTPFINVNPNFRVYEVDPGSFELRDYTEYYFNLSATSETSSPNWQPLYSFKQQYGLQTMKFREVGELVKRFAENSTLRDIYFRNKVRVGDRFLKEGCDRKCHRLNICLMAKSMHNDNRVCNEMLKIYKD